MADSMGSAQSVLAEQADIVLFVALYWLECWKKFPAATINKARVSKDISMAAKDLILALKGASGKRKQGDLL
jgi:hypothetical protein